MANEAVDVWLKPYEQTGGKTAMRVPAIVQKYCLSICSADFRSPFFS